eukprot:CAMPEP_0118645162 /NCGR_PEP_ID=MMETSP0785-20121206/7348_1 /TAXON_ID=91992 /ORGANISM="Bolidomonas pacifica, Strain CCMP 1866" /LENGTH=480 /DNA_ID=CAMNT_0006537015 /DNA_START=343 /DNA_END=1782 /DNA_ORIENTATION=-
MERRTREDHERKSYKPRSVSYDWLDNFSDEKFKVQSVPYSRIQGNRQSSCQICWYGCSPGSRTLSCSVCSAVVHLTCAEKTKCATKRENGEWWCPQCTVSINSAENNEAIKLGMELKRRTDFFSSLTIQSNFMMWTERNRFLKFKAGLIFLQAVIRKIRQQKKFTNDLTSHYRPLKINPIDYSGVPPSEKNGNFTLMASFYNNNQQQLLEESDRHIDREDFYSTQGTGTSTSGKWNKDHFIPSINFQFDLILTMTLKDDAGRHEFKGQAITSVTEDLKKSILQGKKKGREGKVIKICRKLGPLDILPLDKSNKQAVRLDTSSGRVNQSFPGEVTVELITFSNVDTKSGYIEEMLTSVVKGAKKKWWALLHSQSGAGGRFLYLFSKQGDKKEREKIMINHSSQVEYNKKGGYIKLASLDRTYMLTHSSPDERSDWAMKMSGKYQEILDEGVKRFRAAAKEDRRREEGKEGEEKKEEGKEEG